MEKICKKCGKVKNKFYKNSKTKDGFGTWCSDCLRKAKRKWRKNNLSRSREINRENYYKSQGKYKEYSKRVYYSRRKKWDKIIKKVECSQCGYNKCKAALEFHHNDPNKKEFAICQVYYMLFNKKNIKRVLYELEKCSILCCNCHKEKHYN